MSDRPTLKLGHVDKGSMLPPAALATYFKTLHSVMTESLRKKNQFRDDGKWYSPTELTEAGTPVADLQKFLHEHGFLPFNFGPDEQAPKGMFDYLTLSGVRLFQEYVRTIEGKTEIGSPDGIVGQGTWSHIDRWTQGNLQCEWAKGEPSLEYLRWFRLMETARQYHLQNSHPVLDALAKKSNTGDTYPPAQWKFDMDEVHLIGIRRAQDQSVSKRVNDDVFLLLINGMVFKFWGSTDPSASLASRDDEPFLIEGQHLYKFGWHKISDPNKVYKALKPATVGVMVIRDMDNDNAFTDADLPDGLKGPNNSINIHWSGRGTTNFSAGCQVISASSYLNNRNRVIDCSAFSSLSYSGLKDGQTRGAYNVLVDLILAYTKPGTRNIRYTLGRDDTLDFEPGIGAQYATQVFDVLRNPASATA